LVGGAEAEEDGISCVRETGIRIHALS
jgi:hypothetical protein